MARNAGQFCPKTNAELPLPLAGSLQVTWVRCGKRSCRCARGARHGPYVRRVWRDQGRTRRQYVRMEDVPYARAAVALYQVRHPSLRAIRRDFRELGQVMRRVGAQTAGM